MIDIVIKDFPMAVSANQAYIPVVGRVKFTKTGTAYGAGRFIKTDKHKSFESRCAEWENSHLKGVAALRKEIILRKQELQKKNQNLTLKINVYAVFPHDKIFTEDGLIQRVDCDNRLKFLADQLFKILKLDDSVIFKNEIEKVTGTSEYMIIKITEYIPKTEKTVHAMLGIK